MAGEELSKKQAVQEGQMKKLRAQVHGMMDLIWPGPT
jgi:hypothetical protein